MRFTVHYSVKFTDVGEPYLPIGRWENSKSYLVRTSIAISCENNGGPTAAQRRPDKPRSFTGGRPGLGKAVAQDYS